MEKLSLNLINTEEIDLQSLIDDTIKEELDD
jgi:hypothetical protein